MIKGITDKKRLLIIAPGIPHESIGASSVLFYHYIRSLRELNLRTQNILLINPDTKHTDHLAVYISQMSKNTQFQIVPIEIKGQFIEFHRVKFRVNKSLREDVHREVNAFRPDIIVSFDLLSAWLAANDSRSQKIVWLGDLNFQTFWYNALYSVKDRSVKVTKILPFICLIWFQCKLWKRIYYEVLSQMSLVIVSSKSSEAILNKWGFRSKYLPYPWPSWPSSNRNKNKSPLQKPTFLFYGSLKGLGSRSAFHFMLRKLYPRLIDVWGRNGFEIIVAGRGGLYEWVEREIAVKCEFRYVGFVQSIEEVMEACHAVLVPIDIPVGNRSRIITAMANNTLVIAHANAALANPELIDGKTCLLARNAEEYVLKMREAVSCNPRMAKITSEAHRIYMNNFEPSAACKFFVNEFRDNLISDR